MFAPDSGSKNKKTTAVISRSAKNDRLSMHVATFSIQLLKDLFGWSAASPFRRARPACGTHLTALFLRTNNCYSESSGATIRNRP